MTSKKRNQIIIFVLSALVFSVSILMILSFLKFADDKPVLEESPKCEVALPDSRDRLMGDVLSDTSSDQEEQTVEDIRLIASPPIAVNETQAPASEDAFDQDAPIVIGEIDLETEFEGEDLDITLAGFDAQLDAMLANVMAEDLRTHANNMLAEDNALLRAFGAALLAALRELAYEDIEQVVAADPQAALVLADWLSRQAFFDYQSMVWKSFDQNVRNEVLHNILLANEAAESGSRVLLDYVVSRDERGANAELYRMLAESEVSPITIRQKSAAALTLHESPRELHQYFAALTDNLAEDDPFREHAVRLAIEYEGPESAYRAEPHLTLDRVDGLMARDYEGNWEDLAIRVEQVATLPDALIEPGVVPRIFAYINDFGDYPPDADGRAIDRILTRMGKLIELGGDVESGDESEKEVILE